MDSLWRGLIGSFFGAKPPAAAAEDQPERRKNKRAASSIQVSLHWNDARGRPRATPGILENVSPEGFAIRTRVRLREGQAVWVTRTESRALKSVVRHVRRDVDSYILGFARIVAERRREDRRPVAGTAALKLAGPHGESLSIETEIRNISPDGVQVAAPQSVPNGEVARLIGTAVECMGSIRYCVPWNDRFLIGLFLIGKAQRINSEERYYD